MSDTTEPAREAISQHAEASTSTARPEKLFPLVRHLSRRLTPVLLRTPVSANQVTFGSMAAGVAGGLCYAHGAAPAAVAGSVVVLLSFVLDNCDGEVARARGTASTLGARLDSVADWVVHTAIFAGVGIGLYRATGEPLWLLLGSSAVLGTAIDNVLFKLWEDDEPPPPWERPEGASLAENVKYTLDVLMPQDFCFILVALTLADLTWLFLAAGAIANHALWIAGVVARRSGRSR